MSYELDELLIARITAPLRRAYEHAPLTLGLHTDKLLHGTTIGAFIVDNGQRAVAFSDGKVSMGNKPVHLAYRKILTVDRFTRLLISGSPVLGVEYARVLRSYIGYREDTSGQPMSARAKVHFLMRQLKGGLGLMGAGILCAPILVTYDTREKMCARIFSLGPDGSEIPHLDFASGGSGSNIDIDLRRSWRPGMSADEGIALAHQVITTVAPEIDSFSGGKVSIDLIGPEGARIIE